jgi:hypothetical protein
MAGQAQRGSRDREPSSRLDSPSDAVAVAPVAGPGSARTGRTNSSTSDSTPLKVAPPPAPRTTFRLLQQQGLTPGEAASLTAFMCGLPTSDLRWSLRQINQMLFLQRLYQLGRFGIGEGDRPRPH